jgi:hypothetical protein
MVLFETNLAESPKESYDAKGAAFLVILMDTNYETPSYENFSMFLLFHDPFLKKFNINKDLHVGYTSALK